MCVARSVCRAARNGPKPVSTTEESKSMKTWATLSVAVLTAAGLMGPAGAIAGPPPPTQCTGTLSGPVSGDVVVPPGASCTIEDAQISGNVNVQQDATLEITHSTGFTTISGNVKGKNCASIKVTDEDGHRDIVIGGDLSGEGCQTVSCTGSLIGKNFACKHGITCELISCTVGNNVEC